jgi:NADPH-dependent 2,4-dienoyl-CoA reductase/sulfur reductase-like enzyme/nitrite reductase/ring-hydroxylating ferredoxin subunit
MSHDHELSGPDLAGGIEVSALAEGTPLLGHAQGEEVMLVRKGATIHAIGATCSHYSGPLAEGLVVGETVRCPWHHACFSLRTGEALRAPAFDPIACWRVEVRGDMAYTREKLTGERVAPNNGSATNLPSSVVIVGSGAAGLAAAEMLRREGYSGTLTMISADDSAPYDRPNLSKDFLAGNAPEDWMPLRSPDFYGERQIELVLNSRVVSLDAKQKQIKLEGGASRTFDALLIATGAEPVRLDFEGAAAVPVHYLRSFADSRAIIASAASAKRAAVIGASFIGLEVAASLRARGIDVDVIAPEHTPLERVMGSEVGLMIRKLHETHGVVFHLGETVKRLDGRRLTLSGGSTLEADLVVCGVGVRPSVSLAEQAGLTLDHGIVVNEYLETSAPGIFAAGDIARWPDPHSGEHIRVEHWVVAERQGQTAAKNILGQRQPFNAVPFFWSQHYDVAINYIGHAERWDALSIDGGLEDRHCAVTYKRGSRVLAVVTISRDRQSLEAEVAMESGSS